MTESHSSTIRLGTRGSPLARWQTEHVMARLQTAWPGLHFEIKILTTRGDQVLDTPLPLIGGKGLFTAELEQALYTRQIDLAVHSLKDLPTELPTHLAIGAILPRADPRDVLVCRGNYTLNTLPPGATIGTSSRRRAAQLRYQRPDLKIADIRGNVDTRIRKVFDLNGIYDATLLAYAGLERLGRLDVVSEILSFDQMLPAPGQGALAVECRDEPQAQQWLSPINNPVTYITTTTERAFLSGLGGGCTLPIAAYATLVESILFLRGRITAPDGRRQIQVSGSVALEPGDEKALFLARQLGADVAQQAYEQGAAAILEQSTDED